ncbi:transglycosylase [Lactiplantibacillus pentosus]|uniref:LysM peptidoglycan-binding domain-containing protein n=1 Tax=Lactiplantibacillus pentosus TaxID=1589 RepID=UPI000D012BD0|nr:LysM peptidoglycan-binding domain-containing protein [Lactiplantibacillus pentosus]MCT3283278.1 LysM peptidoglycan-binding domain-containing protein [Lactiplantibacillus pentosus]MCT3302750.1 LysM peptidoglycan-binding domain-containing protein [Lactiplantibacillus pentosus]PRO80252.1 transglycosylase [Lactiplantibacillus pentosus]PRO83015.1 transglycosylase [Lactiplantibacillus pentosus]PRO92487.1 transglycosylase [Lactiplantibacillus pentosus]
MKIKNLVLSSTAALALFAISTTVANADTYTVKAGDTVSEIALAHNTSVSAIEKANKLANVNLIFVGDKLEVNGSTTTTTSAATSAAPQSATSQATSSAASTATSASATSASSQSVASQASSSAATSAASSSATSSAATSSTASSAATSSVATSAASSASSTSSAASQASSAASSSASSTSTTSSYTGSNLKSYVLSQMQSRTGVSASTWNTIITRESGWNTTVKNSTSGAYGLFQNMHISSGSVEEQVDAAVSLYNAQGMSAWAL